VELGTSNIDGQHARGSVLEEAIRETAGGCAKVEAGEAIGVDGECAEGSLQLGATAADVPFRLSDVEQRGGIEGLGGLHQYKRAAANPAGGNQALRGPSRFGEASFDQQHIGTEFGHECIVRWAEWREAAGRRLRIDIRAPRLDNCRMSAPQRVQAELESLGLPGKVRTFDDATTHTAQEAADAVGCELGQIVKTLFFMADGRPTMALVAGDRSVDTAALSEILGVGRKKLKMGTPEEVLATTGFAVGGVAPIGWNEPCDAIADESLQRFEEVWAAAGAANAVFPARTADLVTVAKAQWARITREPAP